MSTKIEAELEVCEAKTGLKKNVCRIRMRSAKRSGLDLRMGRFSVTYIRNSVEAAGHVDDIRAFIAANEGQLEGKRIGADGPQTFICQHRIQRANGETGVDGAI